MVPWHFSEGEYFKLISASRSNNDRLREVQRNFRHLMHYQSKNMASLQNLHTVFLKIFHAIVPCSIISVSNEGRLYNKIKSAPRDLSYNSSFAAFSSKYVTKNIHLDIYPGVK